MNNKNLLTRIGEAIDQYRAERTATIASTPISLPTSGARRFGQWMMPNGGTLVIAAILVLTQGVWAQPSYAPTAPSTSTGTMAYQGRLADSNGSALTGTYSMIFRFYNLAVGGAPLWEEQWTGPNSVRVSDGLFNVMLGSLTTIPQSVVTANSTLWLGVTVGTDNEMAPRVQLGSVPFAVQALTVPDGSITAAKLAPDVSLVPSAGSITTTMLANGAITSEKLDAIDAYSYVPNQESTTSSTPTSLTTPHFVTISLARPQWVNIFYGAICAASTGSPAYISLSIDGGPYFGESLIEMWNSSVTTISGFYHVQLPAGTHTITVTYHTSGGTATYWQRKLLVTSISQP